MVLERHDPGYEAGTKMQLLEKDGRAYMRLDDKVDGVDVPPRIAQLIKISLWAERRYARELNRAGTKQFGILEKLGHPYEKTLNTLSEEVTNCHQTALYAAGLIELSDPDRNYDVALFDDKEYHRFFTKDDLRANIQGVIGENLGLVQIREARGDIVHSFIVGADSMGRLVCFEKQNPYRPFRVISIDNIYDRDDNLENEWAVATIDSIAPGTARGDMLRQKLLEYAKK